MYINLVPVTVLPPLLPPCGYARGITGYAAAGCLLEELFFPFPAVDIVERSVLGSGSSPSASAGVATQGLTPDTPPPVLLEEDFLSVSVGCQRELPVSGFGSSLFASAGVATQG